MNYWNLYDEIIAGLPQDIHIDDYAVGRPWTYVRAGDLVGICMTIPAYSRPRLRKESFLGCSLREAGEYVRSWQGQEASIATAAINAFYNQPSKVEAMQGFHGEDASAETLDERKKLEAFAMYTEQIRGKKVAVIGHFPNFQKKWESICDLSILEMQPEWGGLPGGGGRVPSAAAGLCLYDRGDLCQQDHAAPLRALKECRDCPRWPLRAHASMSF